MMNYIIYKKNDYNKVNKEAESISDNRRDKNKKRRKIKIVGTIITITALGGLSIFCKNNLDTRKANEKIEKYTYDQQLSKNAKYTYVDELLSKKARKNIKELEQYLPLSEELNKLKERTFFGMDYLTIKTITKKDEYDKLDQTKYTPKEISKDIKKLNNYLDKYENGSLKLEIASKETKAYYELLIKVLKEDVAVCNNKIAEGYSELENLYQNIITSAYLQIAKLPVEDAKNLNYDDLEDDYKFKYNTSNFPKEAHPKFEYNIDITDVKNIINKLSKNSTSVKFGDKEIYSEYNKNRNEIITKALNYAKILLYYDYNIKQDFFNEDKQNLTGKLNFQKVKVRNK